MTYKHWKVFFSGCASRKIKFFLKNFFNKCEQIRRRQWIWSQLLQKSLIENFIYSAVLALIEAVAQGVLRDLEKFIGKHLCQSLFFNKVVGLRPATLLKKSMVAAPLPLILGRDLKISDQNNWGKDGGRVEDLKKN